MKEQPSYKMEKKDGRVSVCRIPGKEMSKDAKLFQKAVADITDNEFKDGFYHSMNPKNAWPRRKYFCEACGDITIIEHNDEIGGCHSCGKALHIFHQEGDAHGTR